MNHLLEAKENVKLIGKINQTDNVQSLMSVTQALALIVIAEEQQKQTLIQDRIRSHLLNIKEALSDEEKCISKCNPGQ